MLIGYGNELRGDDAIGLIVAEQVAAWDRPGVRVIVTGQLTPELSEDLARASLAIFVDAQLLIGRHDEGRVGWRTLAPSAGNHSLGHSSDPQALLALALALYGYAPPAWLLVVPARSFELGAPLSPLGRRGIEAATRALAELLYHG